MISTLLIIQIVLAIAITIAVLLQKSSSIGLGAYSGSNESVFGAKGPTGFLAKLTFILAFAFIINTLSLGYLYTSSHGASVADAIPANNKAVPSAPTTKEDNVTTAPPAPIAPPAPVVVEKKVVVAPTAPIVIEKNVTVTTPAVVEEKVEIEKNVTTPTPVVVEENISVAPPAPVEIINEVTEENSTN